MVSIDKFDAKTNCKELPITVTEPRQNHLIIMVRRVETLHCDLLGMKPTL